MDQKISAQFHNRSSIKQLMMKKQDATAILAERIQEKEALYAAQTVLLKDQLKSSLESLKPINIIKEALSSSTVKSSLIDSAIGATSGLLVQKTIVRSSNNIVLKVVGSMIGMGVANLLTRHTDGILSIGGKLYSMLASKKKNKETKE